MGQWVPELVQVGSEWAPLRKVAKSRTRDVARTIRTCVLLRTGRACFGVLRRCVCTPSPRGRQPKSPGSIRDAFSKRFRRLPRQCVIQGPSQRSRKRSRCLFQSLSARSPRAPFPRAAASAFVCGPVPTHRGHFPFPREKGSEKGSYQTLAGVGRKPDFLQKSGWKSCLRGRPQRGPEWHLVRLFWHRRNKIGTFCAASGKPRRHLAFFLCACRATAGCEDWAASEELGVWAGWGDRGMGRLGGRGVTEDGGMRRSGGCGGVGSKAGSG